jgi:hypothetical protein
MNPTDVVRDAEVVLQYTLEKYIMQTDPLNQQIGQGNIDVKIMVHGQSLGGMSAAYMSTKEKKHPINFIFIDRTFASLDSVAFWGAGIAIMMNSLLDSRETKHSFCCMNRTFVTEKFGKFISAIFKFITQWKIDCADCYAKINKSNN